jgi:hypothetical protein
MYLKLFLVALVSFTIPSCMEDYSQYEKEFETAVHVQSYSNKQFMYWLQAKVEKGENLKGCVEILEKAKILRDYRDKAFEELENDKLEGLEKPNLKSYVIFFKTTLNELRNHESAAEENILKIDSLLKRLEFYQKRDEKIYRLVLMATYLELEEECIKIYINQVTAKNSLKYRDKNKIKVNQEYKMVLRSEVFDPEVNHLEYDSVRFFIDGVETKMDYNLRVIGGIGVLKFTPNQVGIYSIKGKRYLVSNSNPRKRKLRSYFYQKNVQK